MKKNHSNKLLFGNSYQKRIILAESKKNFYGTEPSLFRLL
jgi:hypothetical protein